MECLCLIWKKLNSSYIKITDAIGIQIQIFIAINNPDNNSIKKTMKINLSNFKI